MSYLYALVHTDRNGDPKHWHEFGRYAKWAADMAARECYPQQERAVRGRAVAVVAVLAALTLGVDVPEDEAAWEDDGGAVLR